MNENIRSPRSPAAHGQPPQFPPQPPTEWPPASPASQPTGGLPAGARVPSRQGLWDAREDTPPGPGLPTRRATLKREREGKPGAAGGHHENGEGASDKKARNPASTSSSVTTSGSSASSSLAVGPGGGAFTREQALAFFTKRTGPLPTDDAARWVALKQYLLESDIAWDGTTLSRLIDAIKDLGPVESLLGPLLMQPGLDPACRGQACWALGMAWMEAQGQALARAPSHRPAPRPLSADCIETAPLRYGQMLRALVAGAQALPDSLVALARLGEGLSHTLAFLRSTWDADGLGPGQPVALTGAMPWVVCQSNLSVAQALALMMAMDPRWLPLEVLLPMYGTPGGPDGDRLLALHTLAERLGEAPVAELLALRQDRSDNPLAWALLHGPERTRLLLARASLANPRCDVLELRPAEIADMTDKGLREKLESALTASWEMDSEDQQVLAGVALGSLAPDGGGQRRVVAQSMRALFSRLQAMPNNTHTSHWAARIIQGLMLAVPEWDPGDTLETLLPLPLRRPAAEWSAGVMHLLAGIGRALQCTLPAREVRTSLEELLGASLAERRMVGLPAPLRPLLDLVSLASYLPQLARPAGDDATSLENAMHHWAHALVAAVRGTPGIHPSYDLARLLADATHGMRTGLSEAQAHALQDALLDEVLRVDLDPVARGRMVTGILVAHASLIPLPGSSTTALHAALVQACARLAPRRLARVMVAHGAAYPQQVVPTLSAAQLAQAGFSREQVAVLGYANAWLDRPTAQLLELPLGNAIAQPRSTGPTPSPDGKAAQALRDAWLLGRQASDAPVQALRKPLAALRQAALRLVLMMGEWRPGPVDAPGLLQEVLCWQELELKHDAILRLVGAHATQLRTLDFQSLRKRLTGDIQALLDADPVTDGKAETDVHYREVIARRTLHHPQTRTRYEEASSCLTAAYERLPQAFGAAYQRDPCSVSCETLESIHAFLTEELVDVTRPGVPDMVARPVMAVLEREARKVTEALDGVSGAGASSSSSSSSVTTQSTPAEVQPLDQ